MKYFLSIHALLISVSDFLPFLNVFHMLHVFLDQGQCVWRRNDHANVGDGKVAGTKMAKNVNQDKSDL